MHRMITHNPNVIPLTCDVYFITKFKGFSGPMVIEIWVFAMRSHSLKWTLANYC